MQSNRSFWTEWAYFLQRWGVRDLAALLLEAAGPAHFIVANMVYAGQPLFRQVMPADRLQALTSLFEDQNESRLFAAFLREETSA